MRLLDQIVIAGAAFVLVVAPLTNALGAGKPFRIAGTVAFVLLFLWTVKLLASLLAGREAGGAIPGTLKWLAPPLIILFGFMAFELVPLPSAALQAISPATYHLYQKCLNGWPLRLDYDVAQQPKSAPGSNTSVKSEGLDAPNYPMKRPLAIAPAVTKSALLFGGAYLSFFLVAAFYPFESGNASATRKLIAIILFTGLLVGSLGLLERVSWNGKILWFIVPDVWGEPKIQMTRAVGPFIDPDHFADFIGMIFPLALAGVLFPWPLESAQDFPFTRIFCAGALIVIAVSMLLSLSRGVWVAIPVAMAVFWRMVSPAFERRSSSARWESARYEGRSRGEHSRPGFVRTIGRQASNRWLVYAVSLLVFTGAILWLAGPTARTEINERVGGTLSGDASLEGRFGFAKDTLRMIERFPVFGVGLGNWAEIYPHFQSPPSIDFFINHAHNDYVELAAEVGLLGIVAVMWLGWRLVATFRSAAGSIGPSWWPWFAAVVSAFVFIAIHELFDFNLHRSANAFLLCGLAAIAVRLATAGKIRSRDTNTSRYTNRGLVYGCASVGAFAAPVLAFLAATQQPPRFGLLPIPKNRKQALDQIVRYPAEVAAHIALARFDDKPTRQAINELEIATWLGPLNPSVRDEYALSLAQVGRKNAELEQIETSAMYTPSLNHDYLSKESIAAFSEPERKAIESGFRNAINKGYPGAVDGLAGFYSLSDRYEDEARLYITAAAQEGESDGRERFLIAAGDAFALAGNSKQARSAFEQATNTVPSDPSPYLNLLSVVYGPNKDMVAARTTVATGIGNGVDPVVLYSGLADAAQVANHPEVASAALTQIVQYSPTLQNNERLADFYMASGKADRAVDTLRKATMIAPDSAEVYVRLAAAEEAAYLYADADRDYSHALSLDPGNSEARSRYAEFEQRTANKGTSGAGDTRN